MRKAIIVVLAALTTGCASQPLQKHPAMVAGGIFGFLALVVAGKEDDEPATAPPDQHIPSTPDCASNPKLCQ